jgi:hypothetical protein
MPGAIVPNPPGIVNSERQGITAPVLTGGYLCATTAADRGNADGFVTQVSVYGRSAGWWIAVEA